MDKKDQPSEETKTKVVKEKKIAIFG